VKPHRNSQSSPLMIPLTNLTEEQECLFWCSSTQGLQCKLILLKLPIKDCKDSKFGLKVFLLQVALSEKFFLKIKKFNMGVCS